MRTGLNRFRWIFLLTVASAVAAQAQGSDIHIQERAVVPENVTSTSDGTVYIGSFGKGGVYRAIKGSTNAALWIAPGEQGMARVMGQWADEPRGLFWACIAGERKTDAAPEIPGTIQAVDLATGEHRASYALEAGGLCNDLTIAQDGTVYTTDMDGRILKLAPGDTLFRTWVRDARLASIDGIALLDDGHIYVNTYRTGLLMRIEVGNDGTAGAITQLILSQPIVQPDGMRKAGPNRLLLAEGQGRLSELTINGDMADVHVVKDRLIGDPSGVTLVGNIAYVSLADWTAHRDPTQDKGYFVITAIPYLSEAR